ncbi:MAG: hypothetical protein NVS2B14_01550 [Chamaesiphon sp.]
MACNFCRHIFTANLDLQQLKMADSHPSLTWRWNGRTWVEAHLEGVELGWGYCFFAVILVALPTTLSGLAAYTFPPVPESLLSWLPYAWTGLVFLSHLAIVVWLVVEFYQFPIWIYLRVIRQNLVERSPFF